MFCARNFLFFFLLVLRFTKSQASAQSVTILALTTFHITSEGPASDTLSALNQNKDCHTTLRVLKGLERTNLNPLSSKILLISEGMLSPLKDFNKCHLNTRKGHIIIFCGIPWGWIHISWWNTEHDGTLCETAIRNDTSQREFSCHLTSTPMQLWTQL